MIQMTGISKKWIVPTRVSLLISRADSSRLVICTIEENFEAKATVGMDENEDEEDDDE